LDNFDFSRAWQFKFIDNKSEQWQNKPYVDVDLPHDYSIIQERDANAPSGASGGFFQGGAAEYVKKFSIPAEWEKKKVIVEFDGVYMNSAVWLNSQFITRRPYGYTAFHCDLTPYMICGTENTLRVIVNNTAQLNSRWYSGSGIYRQARLLIGNEIHIQPWGVYAFTSGINGLRSTLTVKTSLENSGAADAAVTVKSTIIDAHGVETGGGETEIYAPSRGLAEAEQSIETDNANLWSVDDPYLYTLRSEIIKDGIVIDRHETHIGMRTVEAEAQNGFRLNGTPMKLRGGCVHHDCGLLGAAAYERAEERKVELLKASGFNAVRCAHNPPSAAFLDACDRLGLLVIDEAFDCWREVKTQNDYGVYFADWWKRDMESMIFRDRNHPSVIMWSTGNEIPERDGRSEGYRYAAELAGYAWSLDPTRPITNAICAVWEHTGTYPMLLKNLGLTEDEPDIWGAVTEPFAKPLDIAGYNYLLHRYESDGVKYPDRVICGTETFPRNAFEYWEAVEKLPHVIGDFVWTALDYLGETGIGHVRYEGAPEEFHSHFPWHQAFCGDIDICGFKRPQSFYRDCVWGVSKVPFIAVHNPAQYGKKDALSAWAWPEVTSSWTWPGFEGKSVEVDIYDAGDEVELFLNGQSLGRKPAGKASRYIASFDFTYEPGELKAVSYKYGEIVAAMAASVLMTAGKPSAIRLTPDRSCLKAEFGDLSYITAELLDAAGNVVHNARNEIFFTACGTGDLIAVGTGNPASDEMYVGNRRKAHEGRAMAVVRASGEKGGITLTAASDGIPAASVVVGVN